MSATTEVAIRRLSNFVDGKLVDPDERELLGGDRPVDRRDVSRGSRFRRDRTSIVQSGRPQDAFPSWRDMTPSERSLALLRIADAIESKAPMRWSMPSAATRASRSLSP